MFLVQIVWDPRCERRAGVLHGHLDSLKKSFQIYGGFLHPPPSLRAKFRDSFFTWSYIYQITGKVEINCEVSKGVERNSLSDKVLMVGCVKLKNKNCYFCVVWQNHLLCLTNLRPEIKRQGVCLQIMKLCEGFKLNLSGAGTFWRCLMWLWKQGSELRRLRSVLSWCQAGCENTGVQQMFSLCVSGWSSASLCLILSCSKVCFVTMNGFNNTLYLYKN